VSSVTQGSADEDSRLPVPPALTNRSLPETASGRSLHRTDRQSAQRLARGVVTDAGDLALVGHHPDQLERRPAPDLARQRGSLLRCVQRRAPRPDSHATIEQPQTGIGLETHVHHGAKRLEQLEVLDGIDHQSDLLLGWPAGHPSCHSAQCPPVDARVADNHVTHPVVGEPQRLIDGQREDALEGSVFASQQPLDQGPAAQ
jgi:hypothetical protein